MKRTCQCAVVVLSLGVVASSAAVAADSAPAKRFPTAHARFEQNATDGDVEVVFEVSGRSDGLAKLRIVAPDGRTVVDFTAPDRSTLGMRKFVLESPEPRDVASLKAAYPVGQYTFSGTSVGGEALHGQATLSHELPAVSAFLHPPADAEEVPLRDLRIGWAPTDDAVAYLVELEQDELDVNLTAKLPKSTTGLVVPAGFLQPGVEYQLSIGTVSADGNLSFIETSFTTATKR